MGGVVSIITSMTKTTHTPPSVSFTGPPLAEPVPFDGERDWNAWRDTFNELSRGGFPPDPRIRASKEAVGAVREALCANSRKTHPISQPTLRLAAILTANFGRPTIFRMRLGYARFDCLISALNRYPHSESTACRWLIPALTNLVWEDRETPDELIERLSLECDRLHDLQMHPHSPRFQGHPPMHAVVDYEDISLSPPSSRAALDRWTIRAHLVRRHKEWTIEHGLCTEAVPSLQVTRLNQLIGYVCEHLGDAPEKLYTYDTTERLRQFLVKEGTDPETPLKERKRLRDALVVIHEAIARGVGKAYPVPLHLDHIDEYDRLRKTIRQVWTQHGASLGLDERLEARTQALAELGWHGDSTEIEGFLKGNLATCAPRRAAALLLCMRNTLGLHTPDYVFQRLSELRAVRDSIKMGRARKRKPRPKR